MSGTQLVQYEAMRIAVEQCARIDEAAEIKDQAKLLEAYARQRDDRELEVWMAEIKLRASIRIGELVQELERERGARTDLEHCASDGTKSKADAIRDAGLSTRTAYRYEQLAGSRDSQAQIAGKAAAECYFAAARADREPATMDGLRSAIKGAITATLGPAIARPPRQPLPIVPLDDAFIDWQSAVQHIAEADCDLVALAEEVPMARGKLLREARAASSRLQEWIDQLGGVQ